MIADYGIGLITGIVVGYLFIPIVVISGRVSDLIWAPVETKLNHTLSFTKGLTTIMLFVFLAAMLVIFGDSILKITSLSDADKRSEIGRFAALGIFVGIVTYAAVPSLEKMIRRR